MMKLGYNPITENPIYVDIETTGQICIVGGTGSGKSMMMLYLIYNLYKNYDVRLSICDFKKSGDYVGIADNFSEFTQVTGCIEAFYKDYQNTPENNQIIKILLIDEYAGFLTWLSQNNKKKSEEIKQLISEMLMMGRSRHCFIWCVQQRIAAYLFPSGIGAIDNFQVCIGLGKLSVESRKSLFAGEHFDNHNFEDNYHPKTGQGIILIDGRELQPIQIPCISNKEYLKLLLRHMKRNV